MIICNNMHCQKLNHPNFYSCTNQAKCLDSRCPVIWEVFTPYPVVESPLYFYDMMQHLFSLYSLHVELFLQILLSELTKHHLKFDIGQRIGKATKEQTTRLHKPMMDEENKLGFGSKRSNGCNQYCTNSNAPGMGVVKEYKQFGFKTDRCSIYFTKNPTAGNKKEFLFF